MSKHHSIHVLERKARIVPLPVELPVADAPAAQLPVVARKRHERAFDLHPGVHAMVIVAWMSFIGILLAAFMSPGLALPAVICVIGAASLFVTPGLWARVKGNDGLPKQSWAEFMEEGVDTFTGRLAAKEALGQIMILPVLLVGLAMFMAVLKFTL